MEEKQPLVSIIIPVYQVEKYIGNTIKSVLRQTYKNIEIILVDDGSTDESITNALAEVEREHFTEYKLVRQENKGLGEARNTGVDYAMVNGLCLSIRMIQFRKTQLKNC